MKKDKWLFPAIISVILLASSIATKGFTSFAIYEVDNSKVKLDLFVMSQCPFGVQAEQVLESVVDAFGSELKFNLYFIASETADRTFSSMHGQPEVEEDLRQVCINKYYPRKLYDYLICLAPNYVQAGTAWESCAQSLSIDANKIKTCYQGNEGKGLLSENIKTTNELGIGSSPTIIINGEKYTGSRTASAIQSYICSIDSALEGCSVQLGT